VATNYPEKERSEDPKSHPGVPITSEKQTPSLNPQIEKQLTMGRIGRMTHSSTLLIPTLAPGSITPHLVVSTASRHTQEIEAPCSPLYMTCYIYPKTPGKTEPLCKQDPWLSLLQG
jgi:hypothetical protein